MAGKGRVHFVSANPRAVISNLNAPPSVSLNGDVDVSRTGIQSILNQFFDDGGRALDNLPSGDLGYDCFG
jgi:hypothetical protein